MLQRPTPYLVKTSFSPAGGAAPGALKAALGEVENFMLRLVKGDEEENESSIPATIRAAHYHLVSEGGRVRARLALHAGQALGLTPGDAVALAATAELLHNASLVHDDLHDREKWRRGRQTVWAVFGDEVAVCVGDLLLSAAYGALAMIRDARHLPELIALVHARTAMVIRGQCAELAERGRQIDDMAVYEKIAVGKSGALLSLPLEMAFVVAGQNAWLGAARGAAEAFGIGYQIVDDMEDVEGDAGDDAGPRAVNALLVLRAAGHGSNTFEVARQIGLRHLDIAVESANRLPNGSGVLLRQLALALCRRL